MGVPINITNMSIINQNRPRAIATKRHTPGPLHATRKNNTKNTRVTYSPIPSAVSVNIKKSNNFAFPSANVATSVAQMEASSTAVFVPKAINTKRVNMPTNANRRIGTRFTVKPKVKRTMGKRHLIGGRKRNTRRGA
jgi:hypothetical protein